jgi:two-component system NtrC family sensor kinase
MRRVDINLLVADLFVMLATEMRSHNIEVGLDLGTPAPQARLDPGQLRQALINIVRNSREAMPHGGQLHVRTRCRATQVVIDIGDTGEGIAAAVLPRIFEPFFSTKPYGTGLGLSLTQQIVSEHGGQVVLQPGSTGPGDATAGTCVSLHFPCEQGATAAVTALPAA